MIVRRAGRTFLPRIGGGTAPLSVSLPAKAPALGVDRRVGTSQTQEGAMESGRCRSGAGIAAGRRAA